ncbi:MAG: hypothetical protein H0V80_11405 [Acidobacteria bacterium]|nr:hypothetical protein [Acidobacteriota bacterium]
MRRRAYLRAVGLGMPGFLLSGWAPAWATVAPLHLVVHDRLGHAPDAQAVRAGVELGLSEIAVAAGLISAPLTVMRSTDDSPAAIAASRPVHVIAAITDDPSDPAVSVAAGPRIHTCALGHWRADAWSVAAAPASLDPAGTATRGPSLVEWHPGLRRHGASQLNERFERAADATMSAAAWRGWMAVKVAFECGLRARAGEDDLLALRFDGHKGLLLHFADDGHLVQPVYALPAGPRRVTSTNLTACVDSRS